MVKVQQEPGVPVRQRATHMTAHLHPSFILAALGAISGMLGTTLLGFGYGDAPHPGVYMVMTGVWFGLVIGFAVYRWGNRSWAAVAIAVLATWIGWEVAVNLALQLDGPWLDAAPIVTASKPYLTGFAAGAVGAFITWAGAASFTPTLRRGSAATMITLTGALFGLLLPLTNNYDNGAVLLLPWQAAVAAMIGFHMTPAREPSQSGSGELAIES
jgi:hypothetical protein